ncbi:heparin binding hemagglutinin HbhA [Actinopolyspora lacussalsi]|nr:heparin binding hemagglutinin HbhA [Actinopolyspora lacussalsi]
MATRTENSDTEQPGGRAGQAAEGLYKQARMPLVAALGAGEIAAHAVADSVHRVREQLNEHAGSARETVSELPSDLGELRERIRSGEVRELLDGYRDSAARLYGYFSERGEDALQRLREQPGVRHAKSQVEHAQERFEGAVGEARELADDVLGRVSTTTRSFGEKAARTTRTVTEETAGTVREAGAEAARAAEETAETVRGTGERAASEARGATRRTANRASAAKSDGRGGSASGGRSGSTSGGSGSGSRSGGQRGSSGSRNNPSKQPRSAARNKEQR